MFASLQGCSLLARVAYAVNQALQQNFENLTHKITIKDLQKHTLGAIDVNSLYKHANLALMLKVDESKLPELFLCAIKLGSALGETPARSIQHLTRGLARCQPKILDNIGVTFQAYEAYHKYPDIDKKKAWRLFAIDMITEKAHPLIVGNEQLLLQRMDTRIQDGAIEYG